MFSLLPTLPPSRCFAEQLHMKVNSGSLTIGEAMDRAEPVRKARLDALAWIIGQRETPNRMHALEIQACLASGDDPKDAAMSWLLTVMSGDGKEADHAEVILDRLRGEL